MPVVNYEQYCQILDAAQQGDYAYPAINVTSTETANAALKGFADSNSDGIIQLSLGGGQFASGTCIKDSTIGSITIAEHIRRMAEHYDIFIAIHTDHCQPGKVDSFLKPLIEETAKRRAAGLPNLFNSHMFDGSELPLKENLAISVELLKLCADNEIILEIETGVVGGEEDGVDNSAVSNEKLYTTPEDMVDVVKALNGIGKFMLAATFGNVHGVYKPGNVKLSPNILKDGQEAVKKEFGDDYILDLVFHGGSGSDIQDIHETLNYGVIKMNVDTDTQYAFSKGIVDHVFKNYDGMLRIDGEVGNKKVYDPRSYMKAAEISMAKRISQACDDLKSTGKSIFKK
ncbi:MAG: class II fructose-bisphosphate aldolase [Planctomycetota bacterium]|nr:MAG: class II fructose-bisphosphate aldolase [Planctomycetota bacterium]